MSRIPGVHAAGIALLAGALLATGAAASGEVGLRRLGNPRMETLTAKIVPPYSPVFILSTAPSLWPPLAGAQFLFQNSKDSTGLLFVAKIFNPQTPTQNFNFGAAMANDAGTFLSYAEMLDPVTFQDHVGVFSFTQWSQSFRKDSVDASFKFTMTGARVYAMCMTTGSRAEFATDVWANDAFGYFYDFHQDGGVRLYGVNPPFPPAYNITNHGPMSYTDSNPDGISRDRLMVFGPLTRTIDISGVPVGGEFTVIMNEMTQANIAYDEVVRASAYFRDPNDDSLGVVLEVHGLTPTDNPTTPTVAVPPAPLIEAVHLSAPYPNPSNGAVSFRLETPASGEFALDVFDITGRHVAGIAHETFSAGIRALSWSGRDEGGTPAPAGIYFVRARGVGVDLVRRIVRMAP